MRFTIRPGAAAILASLLAAGCASPAPESLLWRANRFQQGAGNPIYDERLLDEQGWQVWRRVRPEQVNCVAFKTAAGLPAAEFTATDQVGVVKNSAGFYLAAEPGRERVEHGFFGRHVYGRRAEVEHAGATLIDVPLQQALSWDGENVAFSIESLPDPLSREAPQLQTGTLDFSGIRRAYEVLLLCRE